MKRLLLAGVAAILAAAIAPCALAAPAIAVPPLKYTVRTLPNGMKLYAMRDAKSASVTVDIWFGVGGRDDPRGRSGFAHLFEHMMFRDTRNMSGEQSDAVVTDAGGSRNGSTLFDYTVYTTTVPANHLEPELWREGERLSGLVIDKAGFEAERHVVEEELRQRIFASPYGRILYILMPRTVYRDHPYGLEIGGSIANLDASTAEDARAFHEDFYRPDNMTVVVSGNFEPAELDRWVDRYLGAVPRPARPLVRDRAPAPEGAVARDVVAYAPNLPAPAVIQVWHAPRAADLDFAAAQVLETLLGEGRSSRLYRALVQDQGLASRVYVTNIPAADGGMFAPTVILAPGKTVDAADAALSAEIARLRDQPVPVAELDRAKNQLLAQALRERETAEGRAEVLGGGAGALGDPTLPDRMLAAIRDLTPAELQRVARRYLAGDRRVDIHYLDESQRASGPPETPLGDRPVVGAPPTAPRLAPAVLAPEAQRQHPPQPAAARVAQPPVIAERTLANGLKVVVAKSTDAPLVTLALEVGAGSSADPQGRAGMSAMTSALVLRAADQDALGALGASLSVRADVDGAVLTLSAPQANIDAAAGLMAEAARKPAFPAGDVERQRGQALSELAETMSQPRALAMRLIEPLLYGDQPYGRLPTEASLKAITADELQAWRNGRWRPDNAVLVVTGALDAEAGFALADKLYGGWTPPAGPPAVRPGSSQAAGGGRVVVVDMPKSGQSAVLAVLPSIARGDPDFVALSARNILLSMGINREVRVKRGLSYGGGSLLAARRDGGHIMALSQTKNESAPEVADLILAELAKLPAPVDAVDLRRREALMAGQYADESQTTAGLAAAIADLAEAGRPAAEVTRFVPAALAVTPAQAQAVGAKLRPDQATVLIVGDASKFLDELKKHHPDVVVLKIEDVREDPARVR